MAFEFTNDGLTLDTFEGIYSRLETGLKEIYGESINLEPNSPDGQRVGILAKEILDLQSFTQVLYSNLDVDFSFGSFQDVIIKLIGLTRLPATRSQVDVTITTDRVIALDAGYTVEDANGSKWLTLSDNSLIAGANAVTLVAQEFGNIEAVANSVNIPVTIVLGVLSVDNALPATAGRSEETTEELRIRRNKSLEINAYSTLGAGIARASQVQGVTDVIARENDTDATVGVLTPHSVQYVVEGGELADIGEVLLKNKTAGARFIGSEIVTVVETIEREGMTDFLLSHEVRFDRPDEVVLIARLNAKRLVVGQAVDIALIAEKIASKEFSINEDANASAFYSLGYQAGTNFNLYELEISEDAGATWTDEILTSDFTEKYTIQASDVTVTEVI